MRRSLRTRQDKEVLLVFDYCQNLEFFSQDGGRDKGSVSPSLSERLFKSRLELIAELDKSCDHPPSLPQPGSGGAPDNSELEKQLRGEVAERLREEVAAMPLENFLVRAKRKLVEKYAIPDSWVKLEAEQHHELSEEVAGLPSTMTDPELEAKLFDALMLRLQLARLRGSRNFPQLAARVRELAEALEGRASIPMVAERLELIQEVQRDEFWQDVTVVRLEAVRKRLRDLVKFIEKIGQKAVYTDFEDERGNDEEVPFPIGGAGQSFERFKEKVRHFLRPRERELPLQKLRLGLGLTREDLDTLDRLLVEANLGTEENYNTARQEGLGVFVRSLVGLDRQAALKAFEGFLRNHDLNSNQQEFIAIIIEELTRTGIMEPSRLFKSPYSDIDPTGSLFGPDASELTEILRHITKNAAEIFEEV